MLDSISAKRLEREPPAGQWCVYMLETRLGHIYTGVTNNLTRRLRQHRGELAGGARSLRGKTPLTLQAVFLAADKSEALKLECEIKRQSHWVKKKLIKN